MRIAFFAHYAGQYGANRSLLTLVDALRDYGVEPLVLLPAAGPFVGELERAGIAYEVAPYAPWMVTKRHVWLGPGQARRNAQARPALRQLLTARRIDLVHSNSGVIGIGAQVASDLRLPHVWHLREMPREAFGMIYLGGQQRARTVMQASTAFIAVSHAVKQRVLPAELQKRAAVIYNGVLSRDEMERLYPIGAGRTATGDPDAPFVFAMLGSISPNKGQAAALQALAALPPSINAELHIAGTGGPRYMARLQRLAEQLGLTERVHFCGFLAEPLALYGAADAVLVCTAYEGMGRVTAEAMALGVPVIGLAGSGTAELIEHDATGLLYTGNAPQLAQQMVRLMAEVGLADRLRDAAWHFAQAHFTIERYCDAAWAVLRHAQEQ